MVKYLDHTYKYQYTKYNRHRYRCNNSNCPGAIMLNRDKTMVMNIVDHDETKRLLKTNTVKKLTEHAMSLKTATLAQRPNETQQVMIYLFLQLFSFLRTRIYENTKA